MDEADIEVNLELAQKAAQAAGDRVRPAKWDLDIAVFMFAVLIIVIILLFQDVSLEITAPIAIFGLAMCWLVGWKRGKQLYQRFYEEELARLELESKRAANGTLEETIEEKVQKAFRERWR
ncbi:hypothetical protein ACFLYX_02520 [Chloroflexota bacterium]